jgi:hypothetical protein
MVERMGEQGIYADAPSREELLVAARIMADMIEDEWPGPLTHAASTWGTAGTPEQVAAIRKLEAYLDATRTRQ